jgi:tetratricopeptide (TPR) repeat protein
MKKALVLAVFVALAPTALAQTTPTGMTPAQAKRAEAYFHFSMARVLDQGEDFSEAIKEYKKALEINPNDSEIYSAMARTYFNQRNRDEAIKAAQKAVELNADNIGAHRLLGDIYIRAITITNGQGDRVPSPAEVAVQKENLQKAIREYEEMVRIDPKEANGYIVLGKLYSFNDQPEKSMETYRKLLGIEPGSEEAVINLAEVFIENDRNPEAIVLLSDFVKSQPMSPGALEMLGDAYAALGNATDAANAYKRAAAMNRDPALREKLAQGLYEDSRLDEAAQIYEEMLKDNPASIEVMQRLAQIYRRQMKYREARAVLTEAQSRTRGSSITIRFDLALVDRDEGKFEDSVKAFETILGETERPPTAVYTPQQRAIRGFIYTQLGIVYSLMGRFDQAIASFNGLRTMSEPAERGRVDMMIADTYREAKDLDKAQSTLQTALQERPNSREIQMAMADLLAARGRADEGIRILERLADGKEPDLELLSAMMGIYERAKRFAEAQRVLDTAVRQFADNKQVYFLQGALYEQQSKHTEAEQAFRKALDFDKNNPSVLNYLGYMLADRGQKLDEALAMIQKAVDADPINGAFLDSLGWAYYKMDKFELAEQYLKRAVLFAARNATMYDHLGDVYFKTGRFREAQDSWTKGLQFADDAEEAAQIRQKLEQVRSRVANQ